MYKKLVCPICSKSVSDYSSRGDFKAHYRDTHEHHITPVKYGGKDSPDNLIKICRWCHKTIHRLYSEEAICMAVASNPKFFMETMEKLAKSIRKGV